MSKRRWAGYIRVSHVGERGGEAFRSPEDQRAAIERTVKALGDRVTVLEPELDESGGKLDRPILQEAIEGVEAGRFDGIVVAYLSRLSRNTRHLLEIYDRVEDAGGSIVSVEENIDTSTPAGRMLRTQLASFAEYQLDTHRESFDRLRRDSTARGIWQRRQTPTGYDRDPETRRLVPNKDADRVRQAFADRASGMPVIRVAERLGMSAQGTRSLLRNRVYLGELRVGDYVNTEAHPPIVTLAQFEAVQTEQPRPPRSQDLEVALLAGIVRCASCGHRMSRHTGKHPVYACSPLKSGGRCPRPAAVALQRLEDYVEQVALAELDAISLGGTGAQTDLGAAQKDLADARAELDAYIAATSAASIGPEAFARGLEARQEAVEAAEERVGAARDQAGVADLAIAGREAYQQLDAAGRNAVLGSLLEAVVVAPAGRGKRVAIEDRAAIYRRGADLGLPSRSGGQGFGLHPIKVNLEHPDALGLQPA
jgi:DNA invertase Pin-like site-specific DNA recombinase